MPGQCYKCGTEFSVFKKERGCKNCGYAFCNKCLNEKPIPVPKKKNEKHHVCHDCYKILSGLAPANTKPVKYDLPEAYLKRVAALEQRNSQPQASGASSKSHNTGKLPESLLRLDKPDREIAMRLDKLREKDKPNEPITDEKLHARLAELKGQPAPSASKPTFFSAKKIPETQQVDELLEQLSEEVALDSRLPDPAQEIEERLRRYRESGSQQVPKPGIDDNNLDLKTKSENNLNIIDKVGPVTKPKYDKNISGASTLEDKDLDTIHQLIAQAAKDVETDAQRAIEDLHRDKELMNRLKVLQAEREKKYKHSEDASSVNSDTDNTVKGGDTARSLGALESDSESDEEAAAAELVKRYTRESKIDKGVGDSIKPPFSKAVSSSTKKDEKKKGGKSSERKVLNSETKSNTSDSDYDDSDELPYCCLCTEDATIRCRDCDLDLYCQKCFVECHQKMDITDHRTVAYKAPKGYR